MADLLDAQHIDAAPALLRADAGLVVYPDAEGFTPEPRDRAAQYVRWYATIERPRSAEGNALDGRSTVWTTRWYCQCVGENEYASAVVAMRVNRLLDGQVPAIPGRSVNKIEQEVYNPPDRDNSTGQQIFNTQVVFAMITSG